MRYQDQIVRSTQKALEDIVRAALAVPDEKVGWVPLGEARSVLSQMQEVAMGGEWLLPLIRGQQADSDAHAAAEGRRRDTDSLVSCISAARASTMELCAAIEAVPDEELERELHLPFGGGMTVTIADVLGMHYWNLTYHLGQINQIQMMLGDRQMH